MNYKIELKLLSDTTFGRGDGVAGLIDAEVEHDRFGLPFLRGRALKGLLAEECANILFAVGNKTNFQTAARNLFGVGGSGLNEDAKMHVGDAVLPDDLRRAVQFEIQENHLTAEDVLTSLTTIRRQTAMTERGAAKENSLRSMRVVLRDTIFEADLHFGEDFAPDSDEIVLLGACCRALQRVGLGRNRGRGKVETKLTDGGDITADCLNLLEGKLKQ